MSFIHAHLARCSREDHVRAATIGVGTYIALTLAVVAYSAAVAFWP